MTIPAHSRGDAPTRTPTILQRHYFLDRYLVLIGAILVGTTPVIGLSTLDVERHADVICALAGGCGDVIRESISGSTPRYIEGHPLEIYAENVVAYLTTPMLAYPILACGVLAVVLQWRTGR